MLVAALGEGQSFAYLCCNRPCVLRAVLCRICYCQAAGCRAAFSIIAAVGYCKRSQLCKVFCRDAAERLRYCDACCLTRVCVRKSYSVISCSLTYLKRGTYSTIHSCRVGCDGIVRVLVVALGEGQCLAYRCIINRPGVSRAGVIWSACSQSQCPTCSFITCVGNLEVTRNVFGTVKPIEGLCDSHVACITGVGINNRDISIYSQVATICIGLI